MMIDNESGKKHIERMELDYFIEAYEYAKGERLLPISASEAPDFRCQRDGSLVGVELTKIMRAPDDTLAEVLDKIYERIDKKKWSTSEKILLVLQMVDCPIAELKYLLEEDIKNDFGTYGFIEIWLADYTGIGAYGDIELFCLFPSER